MSKSHCILYIRAPQVLLGTVIRCHLELRLKVSIRDVYLYLYSFLLTVLGLSFNQPLHFLNRFLELCLDERAQVVHHYHFSVGGDGVLHDLFVQLSFETLYFL